jgi:hypothetical protein
MLNLDYDALGDILYVKVVAPHAAQEADMVSDYVVARSNPGTGHIEELEILFFLGRVRECETIDLPVSAKMNLLAEAS